MNLNTCTVITDSNYLADLEKFTITLPDNLNEIINVVNIPTYSDQWDDITSFKEEYEWREILKNSKDNPTLQEAIERVKILYYLSKDNDQP